MNENERQYISVMRGFNPRVEYLTGPQRSDPHTDVPDRLFGDQGTSYYEGDKKILCRFRLFTVTAVEVRRSRCSATATKA